MKGMITKSFEPEEYIENCVVKKTIERQQKRQKEVMELCSTYMF